MGGGRRGGRGRPPRRAAAPAGGPLQPSPRAAVRAGRAGRMIRSMTGFASAALEQEALRASVSVRTLNPRFFDLPLPLPQRLSALEAEARERVKAAVGRGRIEVSLQA